MRSLDEFYKYIEKQEQALREQGEPSATPGGERKILPDGVAVTMGDTATEAVPAPPKNAAPPAPPRPALPSRYDSILPPHVLRPGATPEKAASPDGESEQAPAPRETPSAATRYELRNGITVPVTPGRETPDIEAYIPTLREKPRLRDDVPDYLPPIVEEEPTQVADAPVRPRRGRRAKAAPPPGLSEGDAAALWERLPRHIQLLVGMTEPREEVAQKYYTRAFKESRQQLIERLLDPTLTLEDTARVLGVCPTTVRRYTNRGLLPHLRTLGQQRRFRLSDVLAFLEQQSPRAGGRIEKNENEREEDDDV